jgi:2-C-methyl-D-erythritol 4-phosphate cytidylyltransferase
MSIRPHHLAELGVIVVAAGRGERLGAGAPKAFVELDGRTLLEHAIRTVSSIPLPGQLVLVVPEERAAEALDIADRALAPDGPWQLSVVHGGRERHESVRFGIDALHDSIGTVLVHDAARPLTPLEVFERVIAAVHETGEAVVPAIPVADTLKRVGAAGSVLETVDRAPLVAAQTPQGFVREQLAAAHETAQARQTDAPDDDAPTDDAELVQRAGGAVRIVPGSHRAHKLTTPADLAMLRGLLAG